jgi:hypothetical protein
MRHIIALLSSLLAAIAIMYLPSTWPAIAASTSSLFASQSLVAVACPAGGACTVVADAYDASQGSWQAATIWRTTNDGSTWRLQWGAAHIYLADVTCPSVSVCVAVGQHQSGTYGWHRAIYRTTDGGTHWREAVIRGDGVLTNVALTAVACPSTTRCYAAGTGNEKHGGRAVVTGAIYHLGSGAAWSLVRAGHTEFAALACPGATTCYAAGTVNTRGAALLATTNGFVSSHEHDFKGDGYSVGGITCFASRACDLALWYTDQTGKLGKDFAEILVTKDGGSSWRSSYRTSKTAYLGSLTCRGERTCFALSSGVVLRSTNSGGTWRGVHTIGQKLADIACTSARACLVVGYRDDNGAAVLLRTASMGQHWEQLLPA